MYRLSGCNSKGNVDCGCNPCICKSPIPFAQPEKKTKYMVLRGLHNNTFFTSWGKYRTDWYTLVGQADTVKDAQTIIFGKPIS